MSQVKTINQSLYDKKLKEFITSLAKIEINYTLNASEERLIKELGSITVLYMACFMKSVLQYSDMEVKKQLQIKDNIHLRLKFIKYLLSLLNAHCYKIAQLALEYIGELKKTQIGDDKQLLMMMYDYFEQGQKIINENYYKNNDPVDIDYYETSISILKNDTNDEHTPQSVLIKELNIDMIEDEIKRNHNKLNKFINKWNRNIQKWRIAENINGRGKISLLDLSSQLIDEYSSLFDLVCVLANHYELKAQRYRLFISYIMHKGLLEEFNEYIGESNLYSAEKKRDYKKDNTSKKS